MARAGPCQIYKQRMQALPACHLQHPCHGFLEPEVRRSGFAAAAAFDEPGSDGKKAGQDQQQPSGQKLHDQPPGTLYLRIFMAAYFCAGFGYVVSVTFIVAIVNKLPGLAGQGNLVFLAIGIGAAPACINWDLIARRTGDLNALILAALLQIVGILLPVLVLGISVKMTCLGTL